MVVLKFRPHASVGTAIKCPHCRGTHLIKRAKFSLSATGGHLFYDCRGRRYLAAIDERLIDNLRLAS